MQLFPEVNSKPLTKVNWIKIKPQINTDAHVKIAHLQIPDFLKKSGILLFSGENKIHSLLNPRAFIYRDILTPEF
ncbi:hypothetical protein SAMD00079811_04880 [Scytonema sp. HK-05]|nr:hypothetical protein NIES2130_05080 [Scytonema sp. HK-05]BAY42910.1 hypothetical protein SAMD00079811_04880 [Scytonema sp. HK-05]